MKVLHFYRTYFPDTQGGLEETIRQICRSTKVCDVESRVLTLSPHPIPKIISYAEAEIWRARRDIDIFSCSMGSEAFSMYRELAQWADIVHFHFPWPFADLVDVLTSHTSRPKVITYHSDIVRQRWLSAAYRPLMNNFLGSMDRIIATSPQYAKSSPALLRFAEKVEVIPIGIEKSIYPTVDKGLKQHVITQFGSNFILFIGVLRQYKGLHILLEAMKDAGFPLVIAGKGPMEFKLKEQARILGLNNVHFTGYVSDEIKMALLNTCAAVILPSHLRSEAFGVSLLEGAMMGKPLISTDINTGTNYININDETGLVVPPEDPSVLRRAMNILQSDTDKAHRLGANARLRYEQYFTAQRMGDAYANLYARIARTSAGKSVDATLADSA